MEIVSQPDMRSADEAYAYLTKLRQILRYLGVSSGDMEKGAMRCEANVSLRPVGSTEYGTKVEVKNLNSFRSVRLALDYEIQRQSRVLDEGGSIEQVTMGWDEDRGATVVQRSKEYAHDYRYFPEPDLPPLSISRERVEEIRGKLPELPAARRDRFMAEYGLSAYDASVLTADRAVADYFETCAQAYPEAKTVSNWITGELFRLLKETETSIEEVKITPAALAELLILVKKGTINQNTAKAVLGEMFRSGRAAAEIVAKKGLAQISDAKELGQIIDQIIAANPDQVAEYRTGKERLFGWFVGQVMKATRGKANSQLVTELLKEKLR
jgi:aspartyl-tRNA(Asn)/glutamyl-tRNA(Gln) amidotransferase subunit B